MSQDSERVLNGVKSQQSSMITPQSAADKVIPPEIKGCACSGQASPTAGML